jgi:23S rRNA pseudouridine1911/1915/1917 synthase
VPTHSEVVEYELDKVYSFLITRGEGNQRVDAFLASRIEGLTRSRVQALIKEGSVQVNKQPAKASYRLRVADRVDLRIPPAVPYHLEPEPVEFALIYEDSSLIIVDKPPGLVIHPAPGHFRGTLVHGLLKYSRDLSGIGGVLRPGIVHRLDKDTSGLLVVAKNDRAHGLLSAQFKAGEVKKTYLAVVHGMMKGSHGEIDLPIGRHPQRRKEMAVASSGGRRALTTWRKLEELGGRFSILSVTPKTGRTHQIRVHLSHIGHPIVGDPVYGYRRQWWKRHFPAKNGTPTQIPRQMLHAETLGFIHPDLGDFCEFRAPMPKDMMDLIGVLKSLAFCDKKIDNDIN